MPSANNKRSRIDAVSSSNGGKKSRSSASGGSTNQEKKNSRKNDEGRWEIVDHRLDPRNLNISAGGVFYERASSRRQRNRAILMNDASTMEDAVPLSRGGSDGSGLGGCDVPESHPVAATLSSDQRSEQHGERQAVGVSSSSPASSSLLLQKSKREKILAKARRTVSSYKQKVDHNKKRQQPQQQLKRM